MGDILFVKCELLEHGKAGIEHERKREEEKEKKGQRGDLAGQTKMGEREKSEKVSGKASWRTFFKNLK